MIGHLVRHDSFIRNIIEGKVEGKRGSPRISYMCQIKEKVTVISYKEVKEVALKRHIWRKMHTDSDKSLALKLEEEVPKDLFLRSIITVVVTMKFCANISFMFAEASSILERYALAKSAGFKAIESGFPFGSTLEQVKEAKETAGIEQVLINLKTGDTSKGELGVTAVPGKENEFKENFNTTVQYAKAVNAKKIHIMAGKLEKISQSNWDTYENNLKYAADVLKDENIVGVIEPINQYSVPHYFLTDYGKAVEIIKRIDSPNLRLMLDVFHLQQISGDISHAITKLMPYVGHVQIAQVPNRNEPNSPGEINYEYVLQQITNGGYDDWVGLEYKPAGKTNDGLGWINKYGYSL